MSIKKYIFVLVIIFINIKIFGSYNDLEDCIRTYNSPKVAYLLYWLKANISNDQKQKLLSLAEERIKITSKNLKYFGNFTDRIKIFRGLVFGYISYNLMKSFFSEEQFISLSSLALKYIKLCVSFALAPQAFNLLKDGLLFKTSKEQYEAAKKIKGYIESII